MATTSNAYSLFCESQSVGKRVKSSKRRINWKFVFAEEAHLSKSHEVVLKHSIMSGKKTVLYDGKELHVSKKVMTTKVEFDFPWNTNNHLLRVVIREKLDRFIYNLYVDNVRFGNLQKWNSDVQAKALAKSSGGDVQHGNVADLTDDVKTEVVKRSRKSSLTDTSMALGGSGSLEDQTEVPELSGDEQDEGGWATFDSPEDEDDFGFDNLKTTNTATSNDDPFNTNNAFAPTSTNEPDSPFSPAPQTDRRRSSSTAPADATDSIFADFDSPAPAPAPTQTSPKEDPLDVFNSTANSLDALYINKDTSFGSPTSAPDVSTTISPKTDSKDVSSSFLGETASNLFDLNGISANSPAPAPEPAPAAGITNLYGSYPAGRTMGVGGMGGMGTMGGMGMGGMGMGGMGGMGTMGGMGGMGTMGAYGTPPKANTNGPSITSNEYNPFDNF